MPRIIHCVGSGCWLGVFWPNGTEENSNSLARSQSLCWSSSRCKVKGKAQLVSGEHALNPDTRPPSKLYQLSSLPHNIAEVAYGVPGQVTGERKEMRSVKRARTNRKKLVALVFVCVWERERERERERVCVSVSVCKWAEGPAVPNEQRDKPHTEELIRGLTRGSV